LRAAVYFQDEPAPPRAEYLISVPSGTSRRKFFPEMIRFDAFA
jgi:hypothetical protein